MGIMLLSCAAACASASAVDVNVARIGFATLEGRTVVRAGAWTPMVVDIDLGNDSRFDGTVRTGQYDMDGDQCFDAAPVHLSQDTIASRRVLLYALPNPLGSDRGYFVEAVDAQGAVVDVRCRGERTRQAAPAMPPEILSDETLLILSVSSGTVGRLADLAAPDQLSRYVRPLVVAHLSPVELPGHWFGLEAVDIIRWDGVNPNEATEAQRTAVANWVRHGGTLVLMVSPGQGGLGLGDHLREVLPAEVEGVAVVHQIPEVAERLLGLEGSVAQRSALPAPVSAAKCRRRAGSVVLAREGGIESDLVTRRREGRGTVILVGMSERDLLSGGGSAVALYESLFSLARVAGEDVSPPQPLSVFRQVVSPTAFVTSGSAYLAAAAIFSCSYVLVATLGTWWFLKARDWRKHAWSAFASVAAAATLLSATAVNGVRGFGEEVHQVGIVDADANAYIGRASAYFGVKTGTDKRADYWLPSDPISTSGPRVTGCFLRPMTVGLEEVASPASFADPVEYRLSPTTAVLSDVRVRATLKQFEGRWEGRLGGRLAAEVRIQNGWEFTPDSYITNELNVELSNCYLLQATYDIVAPLGRSSARANRHNRAHQIYAFPIGDVPASGKKVLLAEACYKPRAGQDTFNRALDWRLGDAQASWASPFGHLWRRMAYGEPDETVDLGLSKNALLLISTLGELEVATTALRGVWRTSYTLSYDRLRHLDLREQLQRDCLYLIGFADGPGPFRISRRVGDRPFSPLEPPPGSSWTMYRIRIPVTFVGDEEEDPTIWEAGRS